MINFRWSNDDVKKFSLKMKNQMRLFIIRQQDKQVASLEISLG